MTVAQLTGSFGQRALMDERGSHLDRVWSWILATSREHGGRWLVVANKAVTDRLAGAHEVPAFVELAHFNALRGLDTYGDVRGIVVLGRPMPAPSDVEMIRGALTGWATPVSLGKAYYPGRATTLSARDGSALTVDAEAHPDALTEAVRAAVCEAEIVQAIGRGRAVNRSEDNPLAVYVLGNVPLTGLMPDTVGQWAPLGPDGEYFSRHGIELEAVADMARLMGERDRNRLKEARSRGRLGSFPSKNTYYWDFYPTSGARTGFYTVKQKGRDGAAFNAARISREVGPLVDYLRRALPAGAELTAVHDPWAEGFGLIQCQVTGGLNFGLAPSH
jgi:putative DNA primase/helicase